MNALASMFFEFGMKNTLGENTDMALKKVGELCQKGIKRDGEWRTASLLDLNQLAISDCTVFAKTCLKVASVGVLATSIMPFLFGIGSTLFSLGTLTCCLLTFDLADTIERFSELYVDNSVLVTQFKELTTLSDRIEFMLKNTFLLGWAPTAMIEKAGSMLRFIPPADSSKA